MSSSHYKLTPSPLWSRRSSASSVTASPVSSSLLLRSPRPGRGRRLEPGSSNEQSTSWLVFAASNVYRQAGTTVLAPAVPVVVAADATATSKSAAVATYGASTAAGSSPTTDTATASNSSSALASSSSLPHHQNDRNPFWTVALIKLHEILPQLLQHMAKATYASTAAACSLLEQASIQVATTPTRSTSSPPVRTSRVPMAAAAVRSSTIGKNKSNRRSNSSTTDVPPKSPLLHWLRSPVSASPLSSPVQKGTSRNIFQSNNNTTKPHSPRSNSYKFREWERLVQTPFTLLLVAEVCVADMQESSSSSANDQQQRLTSLYQHCRHELLETNRILCDNNNNNNDGSSSSRMKHNLITTTTIVLVQTSLEAVCHWISCRCQVLQILNPVAASLDNSDAVAALQVVLHNLQLVSDWGAAAPLLKGLQEQIMATIAGLESCWAVEQALFLESIVSLRQWKNQLPEEDQTRRSLWLQQSYRQVLSVVPLYFDRARALAGPLYGLDTSRFGNGADRNSNNNDLDGMVLDFLKRQERLGGPPTAVALVLDAVNTSNLHPERGFRLSADGGGGVALLDSSGNENRDARVLWPAIYLRSTMHSGAVFTPAGSATGTPRNSSSNLARYVGSSSPSVSRKVCRPVGRNMTNNLVTVLEYGPDSGGATTWPHSDWDALVSLLDRQQENESLLGRNSPSIHLSQRQQHPVAVSYLDSEETGQEASKDSVGDSSMFQIPAPPPAPPLEGSPTDTKSTSYFHMVSLTDWVTMVVLIKKEQGIRWRKRSQLSDEQIQEFLSLMAKRLRVKQLFSHSNLPPSQLPSDKLTGEPVLSIPSPSDISWTDEGQVRDFLGNVMKALGLRPESPASKNIRRKEFALFGSQSRRDMGRNSAPATRGRSGAMRRPSQQAMTMEQSAAALFLGPELCHLLP